MSDDHRGHVEPEWPVLEDEARYGLAGEILRILEPHTEADPAAILVQLLVAFGNAIGHCPYWQVEADRHHLNLFAVLVGKTSKARKGLAASRVRDLFAELESWAERIRTGLTSGEGLIHHVRDAKGEDAGITDKRLMIFEPEFASVLRTMDRKGNNLSAVLRSAWDGEPLETLAKNVPARATGAHVSVVGHITGDELTRYLTRTEAANGFGNRFLWVCCRRSKLLPLGGELRDCDLSSLRARLKAAKDDASARGEIGMTPEAAVLWVESYPGLSAEHPGMLGAITSRSEPQTRRLACLYALLDRAPAVDVPHLRAALAVWRYCEASARYIFGEALGDPVADDLLTFIRSAGEAGRDRTAITEHFSRNRSRTEISRALGQLESQGWIRSRQEPTGGRPREVWTATK